MPRVAIALMAAALTAGCGDASIDVSKYGSTPVASILPAKVTTRIGGATPQQRTVLTQILAGLGETPVEAVELVEPEKDMGGPPDAIAMNIQIPGDDRMANWHADLIADAFRQRSQELRLPPVVFVTAGNGGEMLYEDPALEPGDPGLTLEKARDIAGRMREAAARNNAEVRRLELVRPRRFAFVVVLQADDPAEFLLSGYEDVIKPLDDLRARGYDGLYTEVLDGEGKPVMGSGGWFFDATGCAPVLTGFGQSRPPCVNR
jgi:CheY-like chemotaxis protein